MLDDGGEMSRWLQQAGAIAGAGIIGRLVWVLRQSNAGKRRFWSMATFADILIAVPSAYCGLGIYEAAQAFGLIGDMPASVQAAWLGIAGYLGPYAVDALFDRLLGWLSRR